MAFQFLAALGASALLAIPGYFMQKRQIDREDKWRKEEKQRIAGDITRQYNEDVRNTTEDITRTFSTATRRLAAGGMKERNMLNREQTTLSSSLGNLASGYQTQMGSLGFSGAGGNYNSNSSNGAFVRQGPKKAFGITIAKKGSYV